MHFYSGHIPRYDRKNNVCLTCLISIQVLQIQYSTCAQYSLPRRLRRKINENRNNEKQHADEAFERIS